MTKILKLGKRVVCLTMVMLLMIACLPLSAFAAKPNIVIVNNSGNSSVKGSNVVIVNDAVEEPKAQADDVDYVDVALDEVAIPTGYFLTIYNADGTVGMEIDGTKSGSEFSLKSAIEDARVFVNNAFLFGITTPATYVIEMYEDSTEGESFEIGSDVTINGNGHKIVLGDGVKLTNNGKLNNVTVEEPAGPVAKIGETEYATLAEAIAAANGGTVEILCDVSENLAAIKNITFTTNVAGGVTITNTATGSDWIAFENVTVGSGVTLISANVLTNGAYENIIEGTLIAGLTGATGGNFYQCNDAKTIVRNGGKVIVNGDVILRYNDEDGAGIFIYGDNDADTVEISATGYIGAYSGAFYAENAVVTTGTDLRLDYYDLKNGVVKGEEADKYDPVIAKFVNSTLNVTGQLRLYKDANLILVNSNAHAGLLQVRAMAKPVVAVDANSKFTADAVENVTGAFINAKLDSEGNATFAVAGLAGTGTKEDPYQIGSAEDLIFFRDSVNAGETKYNASGVYVALAADIDLAGINWVGIGSAYKDHGFMGNFDGNGFKIQNLTITNPALDSDGYVYAGLFSVTEGIDKDNQNTIKNLIIENVTISTTGHIVAAAIAYPYYTIVENVEVCGKINIEGGNYTAGVLAYTRRCVNASNLSVVGDEGSTIAGAQVVGGVISDIQMNGGLTADYSNFSVSGVKITGKKNVGGISGIIATQTLNGATVKNVTLDCDSRVGIVAGCLGGTSTISNVNVSDVDGATAIVGGTYDDGVAVQAKIGNTYYATFAGAFAAAKAGDTITLLADVILTETITIQAGQNIVLDLNGKTVTYNSTTQGEAMITNKGTLTINDSVGTGVINYNYTGAADSSYSKGNHTISNAGTLTVNGGKITIANLKGHAKYPIDNNSTTGNAVLVINGGHLYNYNTSAIRQFCNSTTYTNSVTIKGGLIEGYSAIWVQNPGKNTVNGTLTITGGEIRTTAAAYVNGTAALKDVSSGIYCTINGNGGAWSDASFITITGGTFNENVKLATDAPKVTIGGSATFNGNKLISVWVSENVTGESGVIEEIKDNTALNDYTPENLPENAGLEIALKSAGTSEDKIVIVFDVTPKANGTEVTPTQAITFRLPVPASVNEAYAKIYHDGTLMGIYEIKGEGNAKYVEISSADFSEYAVEPTNVTPVAKIGEVGYATLAEAFAAAQEGETIKLLADATPVLTSQRAITKAAVIDLNGKTLTLKEDDLYFGTTEFKNGTIVVDPSVKPSTAVFWMFANQTLTFDGVKIVATGVTGTYLIGLDGNNSDLNLLNGSEIVVENTTALDLDIICVNASTGNDIVIDRSKINVTNLDGRVLFRGNYTISGGSELTLTGITKAGIRIEAGQTLSIQDNAKVTITGEPRDGGIHLTDVTATYEKADTATVNATVNRPVVATVNGVNYYTFTEALAAAQAGDEIVLLADVTLSAELTLPAGITLNGNGKQINGSIVAGGDLTFKGHTKVTSFNAGYNKPTITIGEGACLELTGTGRMVIGHGATFNITGNITDAKTANVADLTPSLIAAGASFTGAGVNFNVTNAYVKFTAYCSSKNSSANGTFNINVTNSIWEQTGSLVFTEPTNGKDPTFNFTLQNSVLNSTSHLVFAVTKGEIVFDNSNVNVGAAKQLENRSTLTIKNGSVVYATHATSSNAKNPGTTIVDNATYVAKGEFTGSDVGTGTLVLKKDANVTMGKITKANIVIDATDMNVGDIVNITANLSGLTGTVSVINNGYLNAKIENGKIVLVERDLNGSGTAEDPYRIENAADLWLFAKKVNAGNTFFGKFVMLTADIDLAQEDWTPISKFNGTFDGDNHKISNLWVTGSGNLGFFSQLADQTEHVTGTVKDVIFENATIISSDGQAGLIADARLGARVTNVKLIGTVTIQGYRGVGGIVGAGFPVITNCSVEAEGTIHATYWGSGAILGFASDKGAKVTNATVKGAGEGLTVSSYLGGVGGVTGTPYGAATTGATISNVTISSNSNYYMAYVDASGTVNGSVTVEEVVVKVNGEEIVGNDAVATINGVACFNLAKAFAEGGNIVLLKDVTLTDTLTIPAGVTVTLDLNGKTVSMVYTETATKNHSMIENNGKLTIQDTAGNGKLSYKYTGASLGTTYAANTITSEPGSVLIVKSGTIENLTYDSAVIAYAIDGRTNGGAGDVAIDIEGGTITSLRQAVRIFANSTTCTGALNISGGEITGRVIVQNASVKENKAALNITGGIFNANAYKTDVLYVGGSNSATIEIVASVSGGIFKGEITETHVENFISGGTFSSAVAEELCANGFIPKDNGNGTYGVKPGSYVAKVGKNKYETLEEAFKAATSGCTIDILADVVIDYTWDCRDYATNGSHSQFKESVTINGNGHTLKFTGAVSDGNWNTIFRFEENATVNNLTINISEATGAQRVITAKKSLTVDGLTIIGSAKYGIIFGEGAGADDLAATKIVIKNSTLTGTRRAISDNEGGKDVKSVSITGNTLNANVYVSASESIVFNNNTAAGEVDLRSYAAENVLSVAAKDNTLTAGVKNYIYAKTIDAQDGFTKERPAFKVSTKDELDAALAAAQNGDTIVLLDRVTVSGTIVLNQGITLDLNGHTLEAKYLVAFKGNHVVDDSKESTGKLIVAKDKVVFNHNNEFNDNVYLPVYAIDDGVGYYTFAKTYIGAKYEDVIVDGVKDGFKVSFRPKFNDDYEDEVTNILVNGIADSGVQFVVRLTWYADVDGIQMKHSQDFVFGNDLVATTLGISGERLTLTVKDISEYKDIDITFILKSDAGVEYFKAAYTFNKQNNQQN